MVYTYYGLTIGVLMLFDVLIQWGATHIVTILIVWSYYVDPGDAIWTVYHDILKVYSLLR